MKKTTILFTLLIQLANIAQSTLEKNYWYIGNKIGFPQYNDIITCMNKFIISNNTNDAIHNSHVGFGTFIGYQKNQYFGFELSYNWLGKIIYANSALNSTFKVQNIDITTKLHYPIVNNKINMYTKFGGAIWHATVKNTYYNDNNIHYSHTNDTNLSPILCIGLEYETKKNWITRIEYQHINNIGNINTIGAQSNHTLINLNFIYYFI